MRPNDDGKRRQFGDEELENLREVLQSRALWRGEEGAFASRFEDDFRAWLGRDYALAVSSGTAANEAALAGCGIGPGDEVICPPCSFIASSMSIVALGAVPVFADIDPRTFIITAAAIEAAITPNAKAVVVVHLSGQPAEMAPILEVARKHNLVVVEDCAQAYGPTYRGSKVGTFGDCACFSLQQSKHITSGEGGIIATNDPEVYKRAMLYANCGMPWYRYGLERPIAEPVAGMRTRGHFGFGHNYRMTELQGAVAVEQLARIEQFNESRRGLAGIAREALGEVAGLRLPTIYPDTDPIHWTVLVQLEQMPVEELNAKLAEAGVGGVGAYSEINYLEAVYQQMSRERRTSMGCPLPEYVSYAPGTCPEAEAAATRTFSLWTHHTVDPDAFRAQVEAISRIVGG